MPSRERICLDIGWKFKLAQGELFKPYETWTKAGDFREGPPSRKYDDSAWRSVDLPHDFVVEGEFIDEALFTAKEPSTHHTAHGSKPGGVGWYRRHFSVPAEALGQRFYLFFDGVFRDSRIYLNDSFVGHHASGYSSFWFDVTDVIEYGGENVLAVRADAMRPEGWFYEGGGIYRHVWLVRTAPLHVAPWGTFVSSRLDFAAGTPTAAVDIRTTLVNPAARESICRLTSLLLDPGGQPVETVASEVRLAPLGNTEATQTLIVRAPQLWSLAAPKLYAVVSRLEADGAVVDEYRTTTGIRSVRFDAERGFLLNEKPVTLKGVCCHQDHAGVGAALPDRLQEFRLARLKAMGCNAYRCAHNPPTPELLDAADRLGILVMDENRRMSSAPEDIAELEALIRRDRNHPSVVIWSIGNEEFFLQWLPQGQRIARTLCDVVHRLDATRPATLAVCFWNPAINKPEPLDRLPVPCGELDVMGFNYMGEYWDPYRERHPGQPTVVSEASTPSQTRGCYETDDARGLLAWKDPRSNWTTAEDHWQRVGTQPFISGIFLWTGFDYRGEPSPHGWPAIGSHFGVMDTCGFPKDSYYYYRAMWRPEPLVHIFPHWNWPGQEGKPLTVGCYSNCEEVELFLNGRSLGRQAMPARGHLEWPGVLYEPGALTARGYRAGREVATALVETTNAPHGLRLTPDRAGLAGPGRDVSVVDVAVIDAQGRVVPVADNEIVFRVSGPGKVIGVGNGHPASHEADKASHRRAFNGLCQVIIESDGQPGQLLLVASSPGLIPVNLEILVVE